MEQRGIAPRAVSCVYPTGRAGVDRSSSVQALRALFAGAVHAEALLAVLVLLLAVILLLGG